MTSTTTDGVTVSVYVSYVPEYSNPLSSEYCFQYRVHIDNHNDFPVRILRREWELFDSQLNSAHRSCYRSTGGKGVGMGIQPLIEGGADYEYSGSVKQSSDLGSMHGTYLVEHGHTGELLEIRIPRVPLVGPCRTN
ncbi:MAG: ApaG domain [Chitinophagaceae bacterium]|nr:MAG: ApaG domain [Chitinophagaceae bacterium]